MTGLDPFDLEQASALALHGLMFAMAAVTSLAIPHWLRPKGRATPLNDPDGLAYLAGGARRCVDAVLTRLYARGDLSIEKGRVLVRREAATPGVGAAEILRLGLTFPAEYANAHRQLRGFNEMIHDRLIESGLLMDFDQVRRFRFWQTMPFLGVIVLAAATLQAGSLGWVLILGLSFLAATFRYALVDCRTRAGIAVIEEAQLAQERLHRAAPRDEADLAVALFGTVALAGSAYADLYRTSGNVLSVAGHWGASWHFSTSTGCRGGGVSGGGSSCGGGCGGSCGGGGD
jgi:uncharacterized protein (TIGR04222 family)